MSHLGIFTTLLVIACFAIGGAIGGFNESACTPDFEPGTCICKLADGSGTIDLSEYVAMTKQTPLVGLDPIGQWSYYFAFCSAPVHRPDLTDCYGKASVCQYATWSPRYNLVMGEPATTKFEMRVSPKQKEPKLALVTDTAGYRFVAFLTCNRAQWEPLFKPGNMSAWQDPDGHYLYFGELIGSAFCSNHDDNPCKPNIKETCVCELSDDSGTIDLTPLVQQSYIKPYQTKYGVFDYSYVFCGSIRDPKLPICNGASSVCEHSSSLYYNMHLGHPSNAHFEFRTNEKHVNKTIALVTDSASIDGIHRRTVAFLNCDPNAPQVKAFDAYGYQSQQDADGYLVYYMDFTGSAFCPVKTPDRNACKTPTRGNCTCELANGGGTIDLQALVEQSALTPYIASNAKFTYAYVFCGLFKDSQWPVCDKTAAICEYSSTWGYNMDIGRPSTFRFEMRSNAMHPTASVALVADSENIDGTYRRSVAFLNCKPDVYLTQFESYGYQGEMDYDGYMIYYMDFTGMQFCPV